MIKHGIYKITNLINEKIYIGSAAGKRGIVDRWYQHKSQLKNKRHYNQFLQNTYNKYGVDCFKYEIIEECLPEKCLEREQFYLDKYKSFDANFGYNLCKKAGNTLGRKHSEQTKLKISRNRQYSAPVNKGVRMGEEFRSNVSNAQKNSEACRKHVQKLNKNKRRPVVGVHLLTKEIIRLSYAGADLRFINSGIQQCCAGKFPSYKGYKWSYDS